MSFAKPATTDHPVLDLVRERWSPRSFDPTRPIPEVELRSLFEASRWAPSAFNEQPWRFIVATRKEKNGFETMLSTFYEGNRAWAETAVVLGILVVSDRFHRNDKTNRHAWYDAGQAMAWLSVEAESRGVRVHQAAGFDAERVREAYGVPAGYTPIVAFALGYQRAADALPPDLAAREAAPRTRHPQREFVFSGRWGNARD